MQIGQEANATKVLPALVRAGRTALGRATARAAQSLACCGLILVVLSLAVSATAANRCVRAGATGANNGTDWSNAYTQLPATLVRGDTYYIADGTYPSYTFTALASGTNFIYVKKATVAEHGIVAGWDDSYGDGFATLGRLGFNAPNSGNGGYIDINGYSTHVTGNWGFKMGPFGIQESAIVFDSGAGNWPECKFRYIQLAGPMTGTDMPSSANPPWSWGFYIFPYNGVPTGSYYSTSNMLIQYCDLRGFGTGIGDSTGNTSSVVEYCNFYDFRVTGADHANVYLAKGSYITFRYNRVWNYNAEGVYFVGNTTGWKIYGNLFFNGGDTAHGIELPWDRTHSNMKIYNNTFVNLSHSCIYVGDTATTVNVEISNNLFSNIGYNGNQGIWLSNGGTGVTTANNVIAPLTVFVNSSNNFHLAAPTSAGTVLNSEYSTDMDGRTRGTDGVWDLGAFEYQAGSANLSTNPVLYVSSSSLNFGLAAVATTNDLTFTLRNAGGGTLQGTGTVAAPFSILGGATYSLGSNQSRTLTVRYQPASAGTHSQSLALTGGGGAGVLLNGSAWAPLTGLSFDSTAGVITSPFVTNAGGYISQAVDTGVAGGGRAVYGFTITNAGNYNIMALVDAPNASADSFFVNIDSEPTDPDMIWDIAPLTAGWESRAVSWRGSGTVASPQFPQKAFNLTAGSHQLVFVGREPNVRLGRITLVPALPPPGSLRVLASTQ